MLSGTFCGFLWDVRACGLALTADLFFPKQEEWARSQARVIHPQQDVVSGALTRQKKRGFGQQRDEETGAAACQTFELSSQGGREGGGAQCCQCRTQAGRPDLHSGAGSDNQQGSS